MAAQTEIRTRVYGALARTREKYHFAPLEEGPNGKHIPKNLVLMSLSYILDRNHLLVGEPGWGKTTSAKILAATMSGLPYDLYDATEIRGNPHKYEEKIVARPDYGKLNIGTESVIWQGSFGLPVLIIDEGNRLPFDSQDVILQGIDTGRWNYLNHSLYEGKKPTFITMNERTGNHENGFLPALKDRLDMVTEEGYFSTLVVFDFADAKRNVEKDLYRPDFVTGALNALAEGYPAYKEAVRKRPISGHITPDEKAGLQEEIRGLSLDNDAMLFLQAFMAEINYSNQYGTKRVSDPVSADTHDLTYAGASVRHSFSPRSAMAAIDYARALAWFLEEDPRLDHMKFVLPYVFAHKADFTDDYRNRNGNAPRTDNENIALAKTLVGEVYARYASSIQPMKNFIANMQKDELSADELGRLNPASYDHPLMKDLVTQAKLGDRKAFYEK